MRKGRLICGLVFMLVSLVLLCVWSNFAQAQASKPIVLRVAAQFALTHPFSYAFLNYFKAPVEEYSKGRIKIDYYPSDTLVKSDDMLDATIAGTAHIADMSYASSRIPIDSFQFLPGVFVDKQTVQQAPAFWKVSKKFLGPEFEKLGIKLLYGESTSQYQLVLSKKPVRTIDDFKGLKVRAKGSTLPFSIKALGGIPLSMSMGESYEAMERGVIDGVAVAIPSVKSYSFQELTKYITTNTDLGAGQHFWGINMKTWNSLPDDIKRFIESIQEEVGVKATKYYADQIKGDLEKFKSKGVVLVELSPEEKKKEFKVFASVWKEWVESNMKKGYPMKELIEEWKVALSEQGIQLAPELLEQLPWRK